MNAPAAARAVRRDAETAITREVDSAAESNTGTGELGSESIWANAVKIERCTAINKIRIRLGRCDVGWAISVLLLRCAINNLVYLAFVGILRQLREKCRLINSYTIIYSAYFNNNYFDLEINIKTVASVV